MLNNLTIPELPEIDLEDLTLEQLLILESNIRTYKLTLQNLKTFFYEATKGYVVYASEAAFITAKGSAATEGDTFFDSTENIAKVYNGTAWATVGNVTNPMSAVGDLIVGGVSGAASRLQIGSEGKALRAVSSTPAWAWQETYSAKSASYTVTDVDGLTVIGVTTSSSTITITLPTASDNIGRRITIKKVDSGTGSVVIDGEGSETIDGFASVEIGFQYDSVTLICIGTSWQFVGPHFQTKTVASTFTGNGVGSGTSSSVSMRLQRVGSYVSIYIPPFNAQMNTSSSTIIVSDTAVPTWARPASSTQRIANNSVRNNANGSTVPGITRIPSTGLVGIAKDVNGGAFTNSASAGLEVDFAGAYYVGPGS